MSQRSYYSGQTLRATLISLLAAHIHTIMNESRHATINTIHSSFARQFPINGPAAASHCIVQRFIYCDNYQIKSIKVKWLCNNNNGKRKQSSFSLSMEELDSAFIHASAAASQQSTQKDITQLPDRPTEPNRQPPIPRLRTRPTELYSQPITSECAEQWNSGNRSSLTEGTSANLIDPTGNQSTEAENKSGIV